MAELSEDDLRKILGERGAMAQQQMPSKQVRWGSLLLTAPEFRSTRRLALWVALFGGGIILSPIISPPIRKLDDFITGASTPIVAEWERFIIITIIAAAVWAMFRTFKSRSAARARSQVAGSDGQNS